jgi:hypothetical protein
MKGKHIIRNTAACVLALALAMIFPATAFATNVTVTAEPLSVKTGDSVVVTITVTGEHMAVVNGAFTYDPSLLSYASGDGGASDGILSLVSAQQGGSSSLTAVVKFVAIGAGSAEIRVTLDSVLNYDGQDIGGAEAGVSVTIAADGAQPSESVSTVDLSLTGVEAENVEGAAEAMYIWRSLVSLTLPAGYADRQVEYRGEYLGGAAVPDSEEPILLYLSNKTGENGAFYIYDAARDTFFPYLTMLSVSSTYTLLWPDETVQTPDGYTATTVVWKDREVPAWLPEGGDGSVYLVYARNSSGERGLFLYNTLDESVQRYAAPPEAAPEPTPSPEPEATPAPAYSEDDGILSGLMGNPIVFFALAGACVVFLGLTITFVTLYSKASHGRHRAARMAKRMQSAQDKEPDATGKDQ